MRAALLVLLCSLLAGCAGLNIPNLSADEVHCVYDRVEGTIEWSCDVRGTGTSMPVDIF